MPRPSVFVSHSQHDPRIDFFHRLFSGAPLRGDWFEFEKPKVPAWTWIRDHIHGAKAVFVILSAPMTGWSVQHTQNWVAWEAGVACAFNKITILLAPAAEPIAIPVPFCNKRVLYNEQDPSHFDFLRGLLADLERQWNPNVDLRPNVTCPECGLSFHQYNLPGEPFPCPCCRQEILRQ